MTFSILILTIIIFLDNIGYAVYEIKNKKNKLGGICVITIATFMVIFVNYSMFIFK